MGHILELANGVQRGRLKSRHAFRVRQYRVRQEFYGAEAYKDSDFTQWSDTHDAADAKWEFLRDNFPVGGSISLLGVPALIVKLKHEPMSVMVLVKNGEGGLTERALSFEVCKALVLGA